MFFSCKHPASELAVNKVHTAEVLDDDFEKITYHLFCLKCSAPVDITYVVCIGGVEKFLSK
jgi:hypothetical protein